MTMNISKSAEHADFIDTSRVAASTDQSYSFYRSTLKRAIDVAAVLVTSIIVVPVVAILALLVATDGHNPFYSQRRVGRNGREFRMWKLRSMVVDADERLESHLAADPLARAEWNATQKLKNDPRITRVGRLLRKTSLDELPQLFNVLRGDMSLVGPRPMMICQKSMYPGSCYYTMRPGITGYWQISDRNESEFKSRALFDNKYAQDVSLLTDLKILFQTVGVVTRATGY